MKLQQGTKKNAWVKHQFASGTINTYHTRPWLIIKDKKKGGAKKLPTKYKWVELA
jgi:hypothetical protein